jgi:hypothetical protein
MPKHRKVSKSVSEAAERLLTEEPVISQKLTDSSEDRVKLSNALNWYSYDFGKSDDYKVSLIKYLKATNYSEKDIEAISKVDPSSIGLSLASLCRMLLKNGEILPDTTYKKFKERISKLILDGSIAVQINTKGRSSSPYDYIENKAREMLGQIEGEVDDFVDGKNNSFDVFSYLESNKANDRVVRIITLFYSKLRVELSDALNGDDEYLREAYRGFSKKRLESFYEFIDKLTKEGERYINSYKKPRAPRKRKEKPAEQVAKAVKYLDKYEDLVSEHPKNIVGADAVWLYNPKYKLLTYLVSSGKLTIKGTTIQDFDSSKSTMKRLRKPQEVIPMVKSGGKTTLRHLMDKIKTKPIKATGRVNSDTLILRTVRS